jgi:hypothetical protein
MLSVGRHQMRSYIFVMLALFAFVAGCNSAKTAVPFDQQVWLSAKTEPASVERLQMVQNLESQYLLKGMTRKQVLSLLGQNEFADLPPSEIGYSLSREFNGDIDPVSGQNLIFELSNANIVVNWHIESWSNRK